MELTAQFAPLAEVAADFLIVSNGLHGTQHCRGPGRDAAAPERSSSGVNSAALPVTSGPSWAEHESPTRDSGGTGCFVRTLVELAIRPPRANSLD